MASLALAAFLLQLLSAHALADEGCASYGTCQADEDENTALLQRSATQKAQVTEHSHAKTTETTTLTCYPNYADDTCGGTMKCFQDTTGCSSSGGGVCCKAAGNGAGLEQCKFCGDDICGPCPDDVPPAPTPTPAPDTGSYCGNCPSTRPRTLSPVSSARPAVTAAARACTMASATRPLAWSASMAFLARPPAPAPCARVDSCMRRPRRTPRCRSAPPHRRAR